MSQKVPVQLEAQINLSQWKFPVAKTGTKVGKSEAASAGSKCWISRPINGTTLAAVIIRSRKASWVIRAKAVPVRFVVGEHIRQTVAD